jgi:transcriptional regulator with XRE-family HTH domain
MRPKPAVAPETTERVPRCVLPRITLAPQETYVAEPLRIGERASTLGSTVTLPPETDDVEDRERMRPIALEIGRALRRARLARGMTLKDLADASADRFRPTSVAGYERGERKISLARFCDLCRLLDVPPERVLGEILRAVEGRWEPEIDLTKLEGMRTPESDLITGFIRQVLSQRGQGEGETIVLRAGDVEVLASAAGRRPDELIDIVSSARASAHDPDAQPDEAE